MKHLEDHRRCPHCGRDINEHGYLMSMKAEAAVLSLRAVAWILVAVFALICLFR